MPEYSLELEISTPLAEQELIAQETTGTTYWEGSVIAAGTRNGKKIGGRGYLEMTGYAGPLPSSLYSRK